MLLQKKGVCVRTGQKSMTIWRVLYLLYLVGFIPLVSVFCYTMDSFEGCRETSERVCLDRTSCFRPNKIQRDGPFSSSQASAHCSIRSPWAACRVSFSCVIDLWCIDSLHRRDCLVGRMDGSCFLFVFYKLVRLLVWMLLKMSAGSSVEGWRFSSGYR